MRCPLTWKRLQAVRGRFAWRPLFRPQVERLNGREVFRPIREHQSDGSALRQ